MTSRRLRAALVLTLSLLLVGMQREVSVHAIWHLGAAALADQPAWHVATDEPCAKCALLAAGSTAVVADTLPPTAAAPDDGVLLPAAPRPQSAPTPFYRSRAPPLSC